MRKLMSPRGREAWLLSLALILVFTAAALFYLTRATTLTVAVASDGGTELPLLRAYADELARRKAGIRLQLVPSTDMREAAAALADDKVDLAVVRPDVAMPGNGLTLAVLRVLAVFGVAPARSGIKTFADLAGKRLGAPLRPGCRSNAPRRVDHPAGIEDPNRCDRRCAG